MSTILYQSNLGWKLNPAKPADRLCPQADIIDELVEVIPWIPVNESMLSSYGPSGATVEVAGVSFIDTEAGTDEDEAVAGSFDAPSNPAAYRMGRIATDLVVDALTDANSPDAVSAVLAGRIAAIRGVIGSALINGDGTAAYGGITGLFEASPTGTPYYVSGHSEPVTASRVADLIYHASRKAGRPDVLVTSPAGMGRLEPLLPQGSAPVHVPALGHRVPSWNGIPILITEHIPSGAPDLYALKLGPPCGVRFIYPARLGRNLITVRRIDSWNDDVVKYRVSATLGLVAPPGGTVARLGNWTLAAEP